MTCPSCGAENRPGRKFCSRCAAPLAIVCPACHAPNEPDDRFCGECAAPLGSAAARPSAPTSTPAPVAERRLVSVLFADLVGFTAFAEERDAEEVRETLSRYFEVASAVMGRYGGTVEKFIGDAVMAVWGTPTAREDDAERAVRAGLELVEAVPALGAGMKARVGILTGEAAVTLGAAGQGMVAGDLVNTASRLQAVAPPGSVLAAEATMRAAGQAVAFEPAGEQVLRGKVSPVPAWRALRVVAARGGRGRSDVLEPPFVGREEELRLLKDLVHAAGRDRRPRLVSITGPAGIGKSRLAWELRKYVDGVVEGIWWHDGRCPAYGDGITFWALGEMVRQRAGLAEGDDEPTTRAALGRLLGDWVPDDEGRRWIEPALFALLGLEPPPPGGRDVLFAGWRMLLERIAARGTTVLVFEDLQWADTGLLDFIDYLLEWARSVPLLVVTLARPELFDRRPSWGSATRSLTALPLEPLPEGAMLDLLGGLVPALPAPALRAIVGRADGIPLYAVEFVRMLLADGRLEATDGAYRPTGELGELAIPETLRSLVASRLDALNPADRRLVQDASVLGQSFTAAGLAAVAGVPADQVEARLRGLVQGELLTRVSDPRSPGRGQYAFVQALVREVAYGTLARADRRARHLAVAGHFELLGSDELAGAVASHYLAAYDASAAGPDADALATKARVTLEGAAQRAAALGAHDQAVAYVEQALELPLGPAEQAGLLEIAARSAMTAGHYGAAERYARRAVAGRETQGDLAATARATALLGTAHLEGGQAGAAVPLLEQALERLPAGHAEEAEAALLTHLSRAYFYNDRYDLCLSAAERALTLAERLGLDDLFIEALINKAVGLTNLGRNREAIVLDEGAIRLAHSAGQVGSELRARYNLAGTLADHRAGEAIDVCREGLALSEELGHHRQVVWFTSLLGAGAYFTGVDWDGALQKAEEWLATDLEAIERVQLEHAVLHILASRGQLTDARLAEHERLVRSFADPMQSEELAEARADVAWCSGDFETAVRAGLEAAASPGHLTDGLFGALRGALWLGDLPGARAIGERLAAQRASTPFATSVEACTRGVVAGLEGRTADGVASYREAIRRWHEIGFDWAVAIGGLDFVRAVGADVPEARSAGEEARRIFERVGARVYLERLDQLMAERSPVGTSPAG